MISLRKFAGPLAVSGFLFAAACSSNVKKVDLPNDANPIEEISRFETDINHGINRHLDVLASDQLASAQKYLAEAKSDLASGQSQTEVLEDIERGRGHLAKAEEVADSRRGVATILVEARQHAIEAGARNFPPTTSRIKTLDDRFRDYSDELGSTDPNKLERLAAAYLELETNAIQESQLGTAKAQIEGAKKDGAEDYAPRTLRRAQKDLKAAQLAIAANRNNPSDYLRQVSESRNTASFLTEVMGQAKGGRVPESSAIDLANKNRQIKGLKEQLVMTESEADIKSAAIARQRGRMRAMSSEIVNQETLDSARKELSNENAEVFQQGNKLIVRLKGIAFKSGRSEVPAASFSLLSKVARIAEDLNPKAIVVEGHTDSTGGKKLNKNLSQKRAQAVSQFLISTGIEESLIDSKGLGFEQPLASNKSAEGRQMNRRVDIIITPASSEKSTTSVE
ncbi:MAG: OmpA family protein [Bdellovibrionales bacterium]